MPGFPLSLVSQEPKTKPTLRAGAHAKPVSSSATVPQSVRLTVLNGATVSRTYSPAHAVTYSL
jgi:hypothetical protein